MRNLLFIGLIGFTLIGCGEKKITEEMLIGNWECDFTQQVAKWKDGAFQDYSKPKNEKIFVKFIKKDGVLQWGKSEKDTETFNLQTIYNKPEYSVSAGDVKIKGKNVIEYISYDKFIIFENREITNDKNEVNNKKDKTEFSCERIK